MSDIFRMPDWPIAVGHEYKMREGALATDPPVAERVRVTLLPSGTGKVQFADVAYPSSEFVLTKREFREVYDPV
jgi:hypothetical protein